MCVYVCLSVCVWFCGIWEWACACVRAGGRWKLPFYVFTNHYGLICMYILYIRTQDEYYWTDVTQMPDNVTQTL
jgi:hypothetical protein